MTTNCGVDSPLALTTGTGKFVGSTSPTLVTPTLGAATATSLAFSPTTGGIVGTTTNNNTTTGHVGEFVSGAVAYASAVSLTSTVAANVTSISLTAGDWDIEGNVYFTQGGVALNMSAWASLTSATAPDLSLTNQAYTPASAGNTGFNIPLLRVSIAATTTVYLTALASFASSTCTACGGIYARRVR